MVKMKNLRWKDLFEFVNEKVNFKYREGKPETAENMTWTCNGKLKFVEEFCGKHSLDFETIKMRLENTGGYCDCEVIFNSVERTNGNECLPIPKKED